MQNVKVWDLFIRLFHASIAILFLANFLVTEDGGTPHRYLGYILLGLLALRFIWGFIGSYHARFTNFTPSKESVKEHLRRILFQEKDIHLGHNPLGALMVFNLLGSLSLICLTGILAETDMFWGMKWLEEIHEFLANYAMISVAFHLLGVAWETKRSKINIIKAMLTGKKSLPSTKEPNGTTIQT
ncbi:cytochrome b/b6 domain-containing protein [Kiloniella sp.]|uniref:cytochrome b/b6 domain-containing protein n=1 Tax=Kiloniella sp. TaxID=1938587 RepID=UPI003A8EE496